MHEEMRLSPRANPGGEFSFTATGLYLSFHLGAHLALEQHGDEVHWRGSSLRGDIKVVLPGEQRMFRHRDSCEFANLTVPTSALQLFDVSHERLRPHVILRDAPLRHLMEAMLAEDAHGTSSNLFVSGAVQAIVARLACLNGQRAPAPPLRGSAHRLQRVLSLIEDRLEEKLSIPELAQACGLSASHFAALFRSSFGEAPHRYQNRRRVERAEALMRAGMSAAHAALAVGFCDQSHFARHARRLRSIARHR